MSNSADFVAYIVELIHDGGHAAVARAMFGGHGLYVDGLFFGIVDDDVLYLRADAGNRAAFGDASPFEFMTRDGKRQAMSYLRAPDEALERPDAMAHWVRLAVGAALRAAAARETSSEKPSGSTPRRKAVTRGTRRRPAS